MSNWNWRQCVLAIAREEEALEACETVEAGKDLPTAQEAIAHLNGMQAAAEEYVGLREWYEKYAMPDTRTDSAIHRPVPER